MSTDILNIKNSNSTKTTDKSRLQLLWEKIEKAEIRNKKAHKKVDDLYEEYKSIIMPAEKQMANTHCDLIEQLISYVPSEKITKKQREKLFDEIDEHMYQADNKLHLYDSKRISAIRDTLDKYATKYYPEEKRDAIDDEFDKLKSLFNMMGMGDLDLPEDDLKEALFKGDSSKLEEIMKNAQQDIMSKMNDKSEEWEDYKFNYQKSEDDEASKVTEIFKGSQLNKIYKQIANVIHPDKEPDPTKLELKKELMQKLTEAKRSKDVFTLIKMYQEHVPSGEFFLDDDALKHVEHLLQMQVYKLNDEHRGIFNGQGIKSAIWKAFSAPSKKKRFENFDISIDHINDLTDQYNIQISRTQTMTKLKKELSRKPTYAPVFF